MLLTLTPDERVMLCAVIVHEIRRFPKQELAIHSTFITTPNIRSVEIERLRSMKEKLLALLNKIDPDGVCLRPE